MSVPVLDKMRAGVRVAGHLVHHSGVSQKAVDKGSLVAVENVLLQDGMDMQSREVLGQNVPRVRHVLLVLRRLKRQLFKTHPLPVVRTHRVTTHPVRLSVRCHTVRALLRVLAWIHGADAMQAQANA
jgi:hypothetical protein